MGRDAFLIVPVPNKVRGNSIISEKTDLDYKNLSQFTKNSSEEQQQEFWVEVANGLSTELEKDGGYRWLSTDGRGVHYLHIRVDKAPKYYKHEEYRNCNFGENYLLNDVESSKKRENQYRSITTDRVINSIERNQGEWKGGSISIDGAGSEEVLINEINNYDEEGFLIESKKIFYFKKDFTEEGWEKIIILIKQIYQHSRLSSQQIEPAKKNFVQSLW